MRNSSGGMITWILADLLNSGVAKAVAAVGPSSSSDQYFDYQVVERVEDVRTLKKSRYYPVEVSRVIAAIKGRNQRTVFVGRPSFIKGLNRMRRLDPDLDRLIVAPVGLFCGHLKSKTYAAYLARMCRVDEREVLSVDYRKKIEGGASEPICLRGHLSQRPGDRLAPCADGRRLRRKLGL